MIFEAVGITGSQCRGHFSRSIIQMPSKELEMSHVQISDTTLDHSQMSGFLEQELSHLHGVHAHGGLQDLEPVVFALQNPDS